MNNFNARIFSSIFICYRSTTVRATIINKDDFNVFKRLNLNAINTFLQKRFNLIYWNDNTDFRIIHHLSLLSLIL